MGEIDFGDLFGNDSEGAELQGENLVPEGFIQETAPTHEVTTDDMNLFFLLDTSGSMTYDGRINQLNYAMPEALVAAKEAALEKEANLRVRIIQFSSSADYIIGDVNNGVSIDEAINSWKDLDCEGGTDTGGAIDKVLEAMHTYILGTRAYHPVVILITDGESNEPERTIRKSEELAMALSGGNPEKRDKVWRFAIGVKDYNEDELVAFATRGKIRDEWGNEKEDEPFVFKIDDVNRIAEVLKAVTKSSLLSNTGADDGGAVIDI